MQITLRRFDDEIGYAYTCPEGDEADIIAAVRAAIDAEYPDLAGVDLEIDQVVDVNGFRWVPLPRKIDDDDTNLRLRFDEERSELGYWYDSGHDEALDEADMIDIARDAISREYPSLAGADLAIDQDPDASGWRWVPLTIWQGYQVAEQSNDFSRANMAEFRADLAAAGATPAQVERILDMMWDTDTYFTDAGAALEWLREEEKATEEPEY